MTLRLSRRPHHHGLREVAYQAHVYDIVTPAGDLVGFVQHNGDGHQLRWAINCSYCGFALGDLSHGVWRWRWTDGSRRPVHLDIETRLLAGIRKQLAYRDRRRIERANARAAARIYAALTTMEPATP